MDLESLDFDTTNLGKDYKEHSVFNQLDDFISFYDSLSYTTMGFISGGVIDVINLNTGLANLIDTRNEVGFRETIGQLIPETSFMKINNIDYYFSPLFSEEYEGDTTDYREIQ